MENSYNSPTNNVTTAAAAVTAAAISSRASKTVVATTDKPQQYNISPSSMRMIGRGYSPPLVKTAEVLLRRSPPKTYQNKSPMSFAVPCPRYSSFSLENETSTCCDSSLLNEQKQDGDDANNNDNNNRLGPLKNHQHQNPKKVQGLIYLSATNNIGPGHKIAAKIATNRNPVVNSFSDHFHPKYYLKTSEIKLHSPTTTSPSSSSFTTITSSVTSTQHRDGDDDEVDDETTNSSAKSSRLNLLKKQETKRKRGVRMVAMCFSGDGKTLATLSSDGFCFLRDANNGKVKRTFNFNVQNSNFDLIENCYSQQQQQVDFLEDMTLNYDSTIIIVRRLNYQFVVFDLADDKIQADSSNNNNNNSFVEEEDQKYFPVHLKNTDIFAATDVSSSNNTTGESSNTPTSRLQFLPTNHPILKTCFFFEQETRGDTIQLYAYDSSTKHYEKFFLVNAVWKKFDFFKISPIFSSSSSVATSFRFFYSTQDRIGCVLLRLDIEKKEEQEKEKALRKKNQHNNNNNNNSSDDDDEEGKKEDQEPFFFKKEFEISFSSDTSSSLLHRVGGIDVSSSSSSTQQQQQQEEPQNNDNNQSSKENKTSSTTSSTPSTKIALLLSDLQIRIFEFIQTNRSNIRSIEKDKVTGESIINERHFVEKRILPFATIHLEFPCHSLKFSSVDGAVIVALSRLKNKLVSFSVESRPRILGEALQVLNEKEKQSEEKIFSWVHKKVASNQKNFSSSSCSESYDFFNKQILDLQFHPNNQNICFVMTNYFVKMLWGVGISSYRWSQRKLVYLVRELGTFGRIPKCLSDSFPITREVCHFLV